LKARVPFTYLQPYSASVEKTTKVPALWLSWFDIDIPTVYPAEAPVVARWTSVGFDNLGRAETKTVMCRHHDGHFYVLASQLGDVVQKADAFSDPGEKSWSKSGQFILMAQVLCAGAVKLKRSTWPEDKRVLAVTEGQFGLDKERSRVFGTQERRFARRHEDAMSDSRDADEAAARRNSHFISIDNVLWRRVSEPKIGVRPTPKLHWFSAVYVELGDGISLDLTGERPGPLEWMFCRLGDYVEAREMAHSRGIAVDERQTLQSAEVLRPELFTFNPNRNRIYRALTSLLEGYELDLGQMSSEAIHSYLDLRAAVDQLDANSEIADMKCVLGTRLRDFLALMPGDEKSVRVRLSQLLAEIA
jgi:hypothetical protein